MIGEILIGNGALTREALHEALEQQRESGALLGEVLLAMNLVTEQDLARALAHEAGVPFMPLDGQAADAAAASLVPEPLARRHLVAPLRLKEGVLQLLQANPFDVLAIDDVQRAAGHPIEVFCGTRTGVQLLLDQAYGARTEFRNLAAQGVSTLDPKDSPGIVFESPVVRLIELMLNQAVDAGATDLHVEPEEHVVRVRQRVDGVLNLGDTLPKALQVPLLSRLKSRSGLDVAEEQLPQDGHMTHETKGRRVDLRVSTLPTTYGEKVAIRIVEKGQLVRGLPELGFSRRNLAAFRELLNRSRGLVMVTGPAGSGKTTTLYSALASLAEGGRNILTVEDPVEFEMPSIRQTQVRPKAGLTHATALRSMLRQDPDVIMVGEIRDHETAQLVVRAALSGVLVFTTLHAQDSAGAFRWLHDMGIEPHLLSSAVAGVVGQRLVRLICESCKAPAEHDAALAERVGLPPDDDVRFLRGYGCAACGGTGYRGRTGVYEVLPVDANTGALIREGADAQQIKEAAIAAGFKTLLDEALSKAIFGETTLDEVVRVACD
jgi:type IV pilus assembly protein PilB